MGIGRESAMGWVSLVLLLGCGELASVREARVAQYEGLATEADRDAWLIDRGARVYRMGAPGGTGCATCHGQDGLGTPGSFPPLKGQKKIMGTCEHHAGIVIFGLRGPIEVDGKKYTMPMPGQPGLSDLDVAAVLSFVRTSWGNDYGTCRSSHVAAARGTTP